jgi:hypothetical protein
MSNQCAAGKRKQVTLMIPEKLEIILRHDIESSCRVITTPYNVGMSPINEINRRSTYDPFKALSVGVNRLLKGHALK